MSRILTALLLVLTVTCVASAQRDPKKSPAPVKKTGPSGFLQVEVILDNEAVFSGLVDKNRMVECVRRHRYVKLADDRRTDFGAGVRLWFYDGLAGFLFFPYRHVERIVVKKELSHRELTQVRLAAKEKRAMQDARRAKEAQTRKATKKRADPLASLDPESRRLLERWPTEKGWSEAKFQELQMRAITEAYILSDEEKEWSASYQDWLKALRKKQKLELADRKNGRSPAVPAKGRLVAKKKDAASGSKKAPAVTVDSKGRIRAKLKRARKAPVVVEGASRGLQ